MTDLTQTENAILKEANLDYLIVGGKFTVEYPNNPRYGHGPELMTFKGIEFEYDDVPLLHFTRANEEDYFIDVCFAKDFIITL